MLVPAVAQANGSFYVNSNLVAVNDILDDVGGVRYELSNTDWDQAIYAGAQPTGDVPAFNLGSTATLSGQAFSFVLEHRVSEGFCFALTGHDRTTMAAWGSFGAGHPTNNADNQTRASINGVDPSDRAFNFLSISATTGHSTAAMDFSALRFSGDGLSSGDPNGAFFAADRRKTPNATSTITQTLFANVDLRNHNWTLNGTLRGIPSITSSAEGLQFDIAMKHVNARVIPEPMFYQASALLLMSGVGIWRIRRRRAA
jgi:hypothetical protein